MQHRESPLHRFVDPDLFHRINTFVPLVCDISFILHALFPPEQIHSIVLKDSFVS